MFLMLPGAQFPENTHKFAEVTSVDLDHLSSDAQTSHVILKVELHLG